MEKEKSCFSGQSNLNCFSSLEIKMLVIDFLSGCVFFVLRFLCLVPLVYILDLFLLWFVSLLLFIGVLLFFFFFLAPRFLCQFIFIISQPNQLSPPVIHSHLCPLHNHQGAPIFPVTSALYNQSLVWIDLYHLSSLSDVPVLLVMLPPAPCVFVIPEVFVSCCLFCCQSFNKYLFGYLSSLSLPAFGSTPHQPWLFFFFFFEEQG